MIVLEQRDMRKQDAEAKASRKTYLNLQPSPHAPVSLSSESGFRTLLLFFCFFQTLLSTQFWISNDQGECNQKYGETNASDAQRSLNMTIGLHDSVAFHGTDRIHFDECKWVSVNSGCEGGVADATCELSRNHLLPHGIRDGVTERTSNVMCREIDACNDSDV